MTGAAVAPPNGRHAEEASNDAGRRGASGDASLPSTSSALDPNCSSLPVIDIGPLLSPAFDPSRPLSPEALEAAEAIAAACLKSRGQKALGFFYATNHGIPEATLDAAHAAAEALWESPEEVREGLDARKSPLARGYLGLGALEHTCTRAELATLARERLGEEEKAKQEEKGAASVGDLKQSFAFGCERDESDPRTLSPMHGPNQWPGDEAVERVPALKGFRAAAEEFRRLGLEAARAVARGLSLALSAEEKGSEGGGKRDPLMFEEALSNPAALTVMLRYPPLPEKDGKTEAASCGTHSDCGSYTLIDQRGLPGLEVFGNNGEWIPVPPLRVNGRSTLVVNLGDLAEFWSGGRVASTLHKVEVRSGASGGGDVVRDSLIVFANANFSAPVVPLGGEGKPTTAGAYILEKLGIMWNGEEKTEEEKR